MLIERCQSGEISPNLVTVEKTFSAFLFAGQILLFKS